MRQPCRERPSRSNVSVLPSSCDWKRLVPLAFRVLTELPRSRYWESSNASTRRGLLLDDQVTLSQAQALGSEANGQAYRTQYIEATLAWPGYVLSVSTWQLTPFRLIALALTRPNCERVALIRNSERPSLG